MQNIETRMAQAIRQERTCQWNILSLINEAQHERTHLERGFSSVHDWLITEFRYSEGAASRRVQAARMVQDIPDAKQKMEDGIITLTTLAMAYSATKNNPERRGELAKEIEHKSSREVERILVRHFPLKKKRESIKLIDEDTARFSTNLSIETIEKLRALRDQMSHKLKTLGEVIASLVAEKPCVTKPCTYQDPKTGRICGSTFLPQEDHIHPKGLGGSNKPSNLRDLCRAHNLLMAEHAYGREKIPRTRK